MAGTPKNKLNKFLMEMIKRDNKEVAHNGVESTASRLQGGRLVGEVDEAAQPWCERVKGTKKSAAVDMRTVVSNSPDEEIHEQIETNESNTFSIKGEHESEEERTSKIQEGSEIKTNSWSSNDKTESGEAVLTESAAKETGSKRSRRG